MAHTRPHRIRVIGKVITVHYVPTGDVLLRDDPEDAHPGMGRSDTDKQLIAVQEGLPLATEQDTVLHEVLHTVEAFMGLDVEEEVIEKLATGLLGVLKDNPKLVTYLRAREK